MDEDEDEIAVTEAVASQLRDDNSRRADNRDLGILAELERLAERLCTVNDWPRERALREVERVLREHRELGDAALADSILKQRKMGVGQ